MSTFREIIDAVDESKPNALPMGQKFRWLAQLEGKIAADVLLVDIVNIREMERKYPRDLDTEPLVTFPHQDMYELWLMAKIDAANEEWDLYQNTMELFNAAYENFVRWFAHTYRPAQGYPPGRCRHCEWDPPYYITAYALAVMAGFEGSLEEWLESLKGEKGDPGKDPYDYAVEIGYTGSRKKFNEKILAEYALKNHGHSADEEWLAAILKEYAKADHDHAGEAWLTALLAKYAKAGHDHAGEKWLTALLAEFATKAYADSRTTRNLLDNNWFPQPVNQRQGTAYAAAGYTIDRWLTNAAACAVTLTEVGLHLKNTNVAGNHTACFYQRLEDGVITEGGTYTMAVGLADGNIYTHTMAAGADTSGMIGEAGDMRLDIDAAGRWHFDIWPYGTKEMTVRWAALYEGAFTAEDLPVYRRKGYGEEYRECCRYYYAVAGGTQLTGFCTGESTAVLYTFLPAEMRANPVVSGELYFLRTRGQDLRENLGEMTEVNCLDGICAFVTLTGASGLTAHWALCAGIDGFSLSAEL